MKRFVPLLIAVLLAVAVYAAIGAAQEPGTLGGGGGSAGAGSMERGIGPVAARQGSMPGRAALAVSGNYIYVLSGGLLLKYDSDLNLIKQVELPRAEVPAGMRRGGRMGRGGGGGGRGGGMRGHQAW